MKQKARVSSTMKATLLISGAGQLGSRYLQGLANCSIPLRIYVQDIYKSSLDRASLLWNEALGHQTHHTVSFHTSLESIPEQLDIAIVATTADVRPKVVSEIASHSAVRFWVLEKVLAQNESALDEIVSHIPDGSKAWVNTPRRMMHWHKQIKAQLGLKQPITLKMEGGGWGLACNAIHMLDLFAWWTSETLLEVSTETLNRNWFEGKRKGYWEVFGTLIARFSGGSYVVLSSSNSHDSIFMEAKDIHLSWLIREAEGLARRLDGFEITGRIVYQSEMSAALVESILQNGRCDLPKLDESIALHRIFIRSMLEHWKLAGNLSATFVPIT